MAPPVAGKDPAPTPPRRFETTHWSVVLAARDRDAPGAREALAALCAAYWYPLYAFVRRRGHDAEEATDLTQEFFARLLEKDFLAAVDPDRGRFRSFLRAACTHFLLNQLDRERALKRGGGRATFSIDLSYAESRYRLEPAHGLTAERLYERRWAMTLLDRVLERLAGEYLQAGRGPLYDRLKVVLVGGRGTISYAAIAEAQGMTEGAVKKAAQRLRGRYRDVLHEQIAETLGDPAGVEDEIRALFAALAD